MPVPTASPPDVRQRVQAALDDDQAGLAFELLCTHAAAEIDLQLLNDMAVIAHAGGQTAKAVHLLHAATLLDPDRSDVAENLETLAAEAAPTPTPASPEPAAAGAVQRLVPHMTDPELALLQAVGSQRRFIVEFGCGGSTAEWLQHRAERIVSVEWWAGLPRAASRASRSSETSSPRGRGSAPT